MKKGIARALAAAVLAAGTGLALVLAVAGTAGVTTSPAVASHVTVTTLVASVTPASASTSAVQPRNDYFGGYYGDKLTCALQGAAWLGKDFDGELIVDFDCVPTGEAPPLAFLLVLIGEPLVCNGITGDVVGRSPAICVT